MKLKPRQVIGLAAIAVFGGIMIMRFTQPSEREVMEQRLASLPSISVPTEIPALPPVTLPSLTRPSTLGDTAAASDKAIWEMSGIDYYNLGSQAARDDLYCAGVLRAEFDAIKTDAHPDRMSILLRDGLALDEAGIARLKAEKAIDESGAGASLAWGDRAAKDYAANALRLSTAACTQRAAALSTVVEQAEK
jgi:hypothetical protein